MSDNRCQGDTGQTVENRNLVLYVEILTPAGDIIIL